MRTFLFRKLTLLLLAAAAAGCAARIERGPSVPAEGEVRRAALARVTVENRTDRRLAIAFLPAAAPGREVVVGGVGAHETATVAPVLAGEPIVLLARDESGHELRLPARSLEIDAEWVWVIPADAAFGPTAQEDPRE